MICEYYYFFYCFYIDIRYNISRYIDNRHRGGYMARKEFETLTSQMYYILLVLVEAKHGYEIMNEITKLTEGKINVGAGTLYTLLSRFETEGYIILESIVDRKKIYKLTNLGKRKLKEETDRLSMQLLHYKEVIGDEEI